MKRASVISWLALGIWTVAVWIGSVADALTPPSALEIKAPMGTGLSFQSSTPVRVLLDKGPRLLRVELAPQSRWETKEGQATGVPQRSVELRWALENGQPVVTSKLGKSVSARLLTFRPPTPEGVFRVGARRYRGSLRVVAEKDGLLVINLLPIEKYLAGTLAAEMSPSWGLEALKAQAVAGRSYALYMALNPKHPLYDMESSIRDQVYQGVSAEKTKVNRAIDETRGLYLSLKNREPAKAFYHSSCGGMTDSPETVWSGAAGNAPQRVPCPYCRKKPHAWTTRISREAMARALKVSLPSFDRMKLLADRRSPSGRIASLRIETNGKSRRVTSDQFRALLGYTQIKSAVFDWSEEQDGFHFAGRGSGHGAGMCQWGARFLADEGKTFRQILTHYYPTHKLETRTPAPPLLPPR